jgi:glycosyltransferase involved in cell wall biosynthesis
MIVEQLVSIIIPCYNMGNKIYRLLDSICEQNYSNMELIIVDDGSTDNSKQVIDSYNDKFKDKGIKLHYVYQSNQGLGAAIDTGLKYINGQYFCWPDADDFLDPISIKERVDFLENNKEYGLVRSDAYIYYEKNLQKPVGYISRKHKNRFKEENLFEDYILERNIFFCPGCHLVRTAVFRDVNPKMSIYPGKRGQNYQLLLPLIWKYKFGYIDKPLYHYIVYENSMSRGDTDYHKVELRCDGLQTIIIETLKRMNLPGADFNFYRDMTYDKYHIIKMKMAIKFGEKKEFIKHYKALNGTCPLDLKILSVFIHIPAFLFVTKLLNQLKSNLRANKFIRQIFDGLTKK